MTRTSIAELVRSGVLTVGDGYRTKRSEHGTPGYRILRVADVVDGRTSFTGEDFVSTEFARQMGSKLSMAGDVVLTTKGTVGRVARIPKGSEQVVYSPQVCFFRVHDETVLNRRYLEFWLRSDDFGQQASHRANNTDMAAYINLADIRSLTLDLPEPREQQAIAEVLGALDDKIATNAKLADTCISLVRARYDQALAGATSATAVGSVMNLEYGKSLPAGVRVDADVAVYGSGGVVGSHNTALVDHAGVVVGRKGTAGAVHWADQPHFPIDTTFYVVPKASSTSLIFCYFALKGLRLNEMNSDSAVPGLNRNEAHAAMIHFPGTVELQRFDEAASPLFAIRAQLRHESKRLAATRDALLPLLMSGKIRVKDAESVVEGVV